MPTSADVLIIGAGPAGLGCAKRLTEARITFQIVEASDGIGGRVRTDGVENWFGVVARSWRLLKSYKIPHAQPRQYPGALEPAERSVRVRPGIYVCGDHRDNASLNGAMLSGRRAAEAVVEDFAR